ncbi:hypothetical protein CC1G_00061 [Coprinopsis cinerea okayama7|uniref:Uncharacterized protein n=1 Tax=Coprinopsis cinerea (strain Okayama-7 / 130 / ATCC MYA-4618 / FGSC 9003) TaxID=240176 RepID=A8NWL6_COPC7|nr:hypothetical protein CC1G_00061 [Coprinopsis cinerea okayama7\|eukprot:XP_001836925.2 hypothetical protein CC1G_00061 [Coprinopsis cinerea okayama7\
MLFPYRAGHELSNNHLAQVAYYWHLVLLDNPSVARIKRHLPTSMDVWGKLRINGGRTTVRTEMVSEKTLRHRQRLTSYVRYESEYQGQDGRQFTVVSYGELSLILVCTLPNHRLFGNHAGKTHLLAVVTPCQTQSTDARLEPTGYDQLLAPVVIDVRSITAAVGRQRRGNTWWIIDQFDAALPTFDELNVKNGDVLDVDVDEEDEEE